MWRVRARRELDALENAGSLGERLRATQLTEPEGHAGSLRELIANAKANKLREEAETALAAATTPDRLRSERISRSMLLASSALEQQELAYKMEVEERSAASSSSPAAVERLVAKVLSRNGDEELRQRLEEEQRAVMAAEREAQREQLRHIQAESAAALDFERSKAQREMDSLRAEHARVLASERAAHREELEREALSRAGAKTTDNEAAKRADNEGFIQLSNQRSPPRGEDEPMVDLTAVSSDDDQELDSIEHQAESSEALLSPNSQRGNKWRTRFGEAQKEHAGTNVKFWSKSPMRSPQPDARSSNVDPVEAERDGLLRELDGMKASVVEQRGAPRQSSASPSDAERAAARAERAKELAEAEALLEKLIASEAKAAAVVANSTSPDVVRLTSNEASSRDRAQTLSTPAEPDLILHSDSSAVEAKQPGNAWFARSPRSSHSRAHAPRNKAARAQELAEAEAKLERLVADEKSRSAAANQGSSSAAAQWFKQRLQTSS